MAEKGVIDFGAEAARMLPLILREAMSHQEVIFSKEGMNISYVLILEVLEEKGPTNMTDLTNIVGFTMSAGTAIVDKMIGLELAKRERSREDRRVVLVEILAKGRSLVEQVRKMRRDAANQMFSVLTDEEKNEYLRLLRKVCEGIRARQ